MEFGLSIDHPVQRDIFARLVFADSLRFSELKPGHVESNLFMYHLEQLIKHKFVEKQERQYALSAQGKWFADHVSLSSFRYFVQPKMIVILAVSDSEANQWLITERRHQPHNGAWGFASGRLRYGEKLDTAAHRILEQKANLKDTELIQRGTVEMHFGEGEFTRHVIGFVFEGVARATFNGLYESKSGITYWAKPEKLDQNRAIPGYWKIRKLLQSEERHFVAGFSFNN